MNSHAQDKTFHHNDIETPMHSYWSQISNTLACATVAWVRVVLVDWQRFRVQVRNGKFPIGFPVNMAKVHVCSGPYTTQQH